MSPTSHLDKVVLVFTKDDKEGKVPLSRVTTEKQNFELIYQVLLF